MAVAEAVALDVAEAVALDDEVDEEDPVEVELVDAEAEAGADRVGAGLLLGPQYGAVGANAVIMTWPSLSPCPKFDVNHCAGNAGALYPLELPLAGAHTLAARFPVHDDPPPPLSQLSLTHRLR